MKPDMKPLIVMILLLVSLSLACRVVSGGEPSVPVAPEATAETFEAPTEPAMDLAEPTSDMGQPEPTEPVEAVTPESPSDAPTEYDTDFPLPEDVKNFSDLGDGQVNFQTSLTLEEAVAFYREAFAAQGLTEYEATTTITEDVFSLVFQGAENGKSVVIQGVDMGDGTVNINIRYEDI